MNVRQWSLMVMLGGNGGYEGLLGTPRTLGLTGRYDF